MNSAGMDPIRTPKGTDKDLFHRSSVVVDLFADPGGWSEGLASLGHSEIGIEWDEAACATAKAAGHKRIQADVAGMDPFDLRLPGQKVDGLIASPPCQAWSMAGKGGGRRDVEHVIACAMEMAAGNDTRAEHAAKCEDPRSMLVVEPLRWAIALKPRWIAMEQVPPVLELWTLFAQILDEQHGYSTWAGVLEAERYGVPQTRERAILMAHRERQVHPPRATHQRYVKDEPQWTAPRQTFEGEVLPWISMAEALGLNEGAAPCPAPTVTSGGTAAGGVEVFASKGARERVLRATHYDPRQTGARPRPIDEPAPAMQSQGLAKGRDVWMEGTGDERYRIPAPTITGTRRSKEGMIVGRQLPEGEGENVGGHNWLRNSSNDNACRRHVEEPAGTLVFGHACNEVGFVADPQERVNKTGVRVTQEQAAVLQSFRPDYPWQGSRTKQFEQIGNAVPPLLARAVLAELIDPVPMEAAA